MHNMLHKNMTDFIQTINKINLYQFSYKHILLCQHNLVSAFRVTKKIYSQCIIILVYLYQYSYSNVYRLQTHTKDAFKANNIKLEVFLIKVNLNEFPVTIKICLTVVKIVLEIQYNLIQYQK